MALVFPFSFILAFGRMAGVSRGESQGPFSFPTMPRNGRAGLKNGQTIATITDKFGEPRRIVQRGSRIAVANNEATLVLAMNREVSLVIGERIRAARIARGFTLEELAVRCGMTSGWPKNRMFDIESSPRAHGVRMGTLYAIAAALNIEVTALLPTVAEILSRADVKRVQAKVVTLTSRGLVVA